MHCTQCGNEIFENDRFCGTCGNSLLNRNKEVPGEIEQSSTRKLNDNDLLKAFVGDEKQSYYFGKWEKNEQRSWNWAAFFATFFWLGYRKMYKFVLLILLFFIIVDGIIILVGIDGGWINQYIGIGIGAALGIGGNFEYKKFAQREIKKLEKHYSGDQLLEEVQKRGGGSWKGFWLTVVLLIGYITISLFFESVLTSFINGESASANPEVTGLHDSGDEGKMEDKPNIGNFETATYENEYYGFSLDYPSSWANRIEISYGSWASDAEATIDFVYVNPSKEIEQYVFSVTYSR